MKMIKKSILALGVVALAAVNVSAEGISGVTMGKEALYTRAGDGTISLKADGVTGLTTISPSVSGQKDFAQYRVEKGGKHYWYTVLDTGETSATGGGFERLRQEIFVRATSTGTTAAAKGAFFEQELNAYEATGVDACTASTSSNTSCLKIKMNFQGFDVGSAQNRNFTIDSQLAEASDTAATRDYQQTFHFGQQQATSTTALTQACQFLSSGACKGTINTAADLDGTTAGSVSTKSTVAGNKLTQVYFNDSLRITADNTQNLKYEFESINKNIPETGAVGAENDYLYQLF